VRCVANTTTPTGPTAGLTPEARRAVTALIFGGIAAILDTTIVTIALHTLVIKLHSTVGTIQWVSTGYLLALAVAIPVTGWAEARLGGKRAWMTALGIFAAGSILCALSWSDASLIGFRVLQGFGAGLIFPCRRWRFGRRGPRQQQPDRGQLALAVPGQRARDRGRRAARAAVPAG
jgi:MFS family permease